MNDNKLYNILDLIEEINNVDKMIEIHSVPNTDFMHNQYLNQKFKLTNILIKELLQNSSNHESEIMYLIKLIVEKFYKASIYDHKSIDKDPNLKKIEEAFL
jgi:predicted restriction endonuclease